MARSFVATDFISIPSRSELDVALGAISFKMKTTQATANVNLVARANDPFSNSGFGAILNGTVGVFAKNAAGTQVLSVAHATTVNDGAWHDIVFNWNQNSGGASTLYVEGVAGTPANASAAWAFNSQAIHLGKAADTFWAGYAGDLAEFAWYGANLSADDAVALARGYPPHKVRARDILTYLPLIRDITDVRASGASALGGTTVSDHPRRIG